MAKTKTPKPTAPKRPAADPAGADAAQADFTLPSEPSLTEQASQAPRAAEAPVPKGPGGKLAIVVAALQAPAGATIAELVAATGWQAHSVRGAISGSLKKKHGLSIVSAVEEGVRRYRLAEHG